MLTQEQITALEAAGRKLADVALEELDSSKWPKPTTKEGRGDRVWMKKNALATLALLDQIQRTIRSQPFEPLPPESTNPGEPETDVDRMIREAEERAASARARGNEAPH